MAAINTFPAYSVKIGDKVGVRLTWGYLEDDKYYLLLNNQLFEFPTDNDGEILITDHLVQGSNRIMCKVINIKGGPFGEPSKWWAKFAIFHNGKQVLGPYEGQGDDWYDRKEHIVLEGTINAQF
jgi:hypothetical protein